MSDQGTILIFHLQADGQPLQHGVSFTAFPGARISEYGIQILADNERKLSAFPGLIEFVGAMPGTFSEYETAAETAGISQHCPKCHSITKGKENG